MKRARVGWVVLAATAIGVAWGQGPGTATKTTATPVAAQLNRASGQIQDSGERAIRRAQIHEVAGRRDPFLSPVANHGAADAVCHGGRRCLDIEQISVRGIVRADAGMIAVVVNGAGKAYFLRKDDAVWRGYVKHIGDDAVVFLENATDKLGKPLRREVVKKLMPLPAS